MMAARPQTLAMACRLAGRPGRLAVGPQRDGQLLRDLPRLRRRARPGELTRDEVLDNVTLYWLTNTGVSASRLYWEYRGACFNACERPGPPRSVPVAITVFPSEQYQAPRSWAEQAYPNLIYFNEVDKGGHFAAWEQPQLFSEELRAAFRSVR